MCKVYDDADMLPAGLLLLASRYGSHKEVDYDPRGLSWNAHFYLFLPIFCILRNQVTTPSSHMMARKYSHVMVCHMSDCVVLVDQARDESRG